MAEIRHSQRRSAKARTDAVVLAVTRVPPLQLLVELEQLNEHLVAVGRARLVGVADVVGEVLHLLIHAGLGHLGPVVGLVGPGGHVGQPAVAGVAQHIHHAGQAAGVAQLHDHVVAEDGPAQALYP